MHWGWHVPWDRKPLTNTKSETLLALATYREFLNQRRLILAEGFFEKGICFIRPHAELFAMAGLWRAERDGQKFTMLTTTPNETVSPYHNRMPFILRTDQLESWLGIDWRKVLGDPDKSPLGKIVKQPELF